jgi:hypothetical protein
MQARNTFIHVPNLDKDLLVLTNSTAVGSTTGTVTIPSNNRTTILTASSVE